MAHDVANDGGGFGRPPKRTRFQKGASGNPRGRPKKVSNFKTDLADELQEKIVLTENGRERRITKQRAFIKTLTAAAIKKDIRAVNALLACMKYFGVGSEEHVTESVDTDDLDILENYLERERQRRAPMQRPPSKSQKGKK
jgi:Family of unknown function (DUF5681)